MYISSAGRPINLSTLHHQTVTPSTCCKERLASSPENGHLARGTRVKITLGSWTSFHLRGRQGDWLKVEETDRGRKAEVCCEIS